jgi:hypothetical protein
MEDKKTSGRGLEEVSHFFLSRHGSQGRQTKPPEKTARVDRDHMPASPQSPKTPETTPTPKTSQMVKSAYETDISAIPSSALLNATRTYLLRIDAYKDAVQTENLESPKFGSSDLLFVNNTRTNIVCARLSREKNCEAFVVSAVAYFCWLKEFLKIADVVFKQKARVDMYLFSTGFPSAVSYLMENLWNDLAVHLVKYKVLRVEGLKAPAMSFRPMTPTHIVQQPQKRREEPERNGMLMEQEEATDPLDITARQWREFNRLKERSLT